LIPMQGWSIYGSSGGPLYDPQGNALLLKALKQHLQKKIQLVEVDAHINDEEFADICVERMVDLLNLINGCIKTRREHE